MLGVLVHYGMMMGDIDDRIMVTWWHHQMESFSVLLALCAGNSPVNSPNKGQWRGALMFSLICIWTNGWVNNRDVSAMRHHHAHYDVTVMEHAIPDQKWAGMRLIQAAPVQFSLSTGLKTMKWWEHLVENHEMMRALSNGWMDGRIYEWMN